MKKISLFVSLLILCATLFQSCCVTRVNSVTKSVNPKINELLADLDIRSDKVTATYQITVKNHQIGVDEDIMKENAVYEALRKVGADVLVAPQFMITKHTCPLETDYEVTVTGYPAYYTNLRLLPMAEKTELMELKEGASYVVVRKTAANEIVEVEKEIISAPKPGAGCKLNLEETEVDHVVLTNEKKHKK